MSIGGAGGSKPSGNLGSARGELNLDIDKFSKAIALAQRELKDFERGSVGWGDGLNSIATNGALIGGAISAGAALAVRSFASFDAQLAGVAASLGGVGAEAGITEAQFARISDTALRIGKDTSFSANEAAAAMDVLAKAGVSAEDIINGVADASVALAAAIGEGIPQSAEAIASALSIFGLTAADAANITDTFTAALNSSQTDLTDFMAGLRNLGPTMASTGASFEDTAAAIAYFTKFGLKGADVGVSLARAMDALAKPSKEGAKLLQELGISAFDAAGNFVGWPKLMDQFSRALGGVSDAERIFILQTVAGAEAADVLNIAVQQGGDGLREMEGAVVPAGQAATQAAQRLDSLAGVLEAMTGSLEVAAIAAGQALAPAVEALANHVASLATAFTELPGPVQETAIQAIAAAGAFALIAASGAKMISLAVDTAAAWRTMADAIRNSAVAMRALTFAFSPASLAIGAVAAVTLLAIKRHRDHKQAVKELEQGYKNLATSINNLKLTGQDDTALLGANLDLNLKKTEQALKDRKSQLQDLIGVQETFESQLRGTDAGLAAARTLDQYQAELDQLNNIERAIGEASTLMGAALETPGVNAEKMANSFNFLIDQLRLGYIDIPTFTTAVRGITENTGDWLAKTEEQAEATEDLAAAQSDAAASTDEQAKAQEQLNQQIDELVDGTVLAIAGLEDIAPAVDGFQAGFGEIGDSIEDVLLKMDDLGKIDLSPAEEEALKLKRALDANEAAIRRTEDAIENNSDDMSMWQSRIDLVDETLGTAEDGYKNLNNLVAEGKLTQEEANEILEAGIWLRERSTGGLLDEQAEQAKLIPILANYAKAHDDANGAVNDLTSAQLGFLAALQSTNGAMFLQTLQTLLYLEAMGRIPPEKVTEFIANSAEADPIIAALIDDLGLLDDGAEIDISVDDNATEPITEVGNALENLPLRRRIELAVNPFDGDVPSPNAPADPVEIPTALAAPDTSAIDDLDLGTVQIATELLPPAPIQTATSGESDTGSAPAPTAVSQTVTTTVIVDDSAAKPKLDALQTQLDAWPTSIATVFSFTAGESNYYIDDVEALDNLLDEWIDTVSTAIDVAVAPEQIAGVLGLKGALNDLGENAFASSLGLSAFSQAVTIASSSAETDLGAATVAMSEALRVFVANAGTAGTDAGSDFTANLGGQLLNAILVAAGAAASTVSALDVSADAASTGLGVGQSFGQGVANGASSMLSIVAAAGSAVGAALANAAEAELDIASPSRRGSWIGEMFDRGVELGVGRGEDNLIDQARRTAGRTVDAFNDELSRFAMTSLLGADRPSNYGADGVYPSIGALSPGGSPVTYQVDARSFYALRSEELVAIIEQSERGDRAMATLEDLPKGMELATGKR